MLLSTHARIQIKVFSFSCTEWKDKDILQFPFFDAFYFEHPELIKKTFNAHFTNMKSLSGVITNPFIAICYE